MQFGYPDGARPIHSGRHPVPGQGAGAARPLSANSILIPPMTSQELDITSRTGPGRRS